MRKLLLLTGTACLALFGAALQTIQLGRQALTDANRNTTTILTKAQFAASGMIWSQLTTTLAVSSPNAWALHQVVDRTARTVTGYELRVTPTAEDRFRLEFQALRVDARQAGSNELRWVSPVRLPSTREVRRGETLRVELAQHHDASLFEEIVVEPTVP